MQVVFVVTLLWAAQVSAFYKVQDLGDANSISSAVMQLSKDLEPMLREHKETLFSHISLNYEGKFLLDQKMFIAILNKAFRLGKVSNQSETGVQLDNTLPGASAELSTLGNTAEKIAENYSRKCPRCSKIMQQKTSIIDHYAVNHMEKDITLPFYNIERKIEDNKERYFIGCGQCKKNIFGCQSAVVTANFKRHFFQKACSNSTRYTNFY